MTREEAILYIEKTKEFLTSPKICWSKYDDKITALDMAIKALSAEPKKAVPPSLADVYKWERDIALSQLEEYGIGFAEKKRDDLVEVVRCKDCEYYNNDYMGEWCSRLQAPLWIKKDDFCSNTEII